MKKYVVEYVGTFFFALAIILTGDPFAIASMLMAWVYIGGSLSGGHYNPAVSLAATLRGALSWNDYAFYVLAQSLGAFSAAGVAYFLRKSITLAHPSIGLAEAFSVETLLAFTLALIVLYIATEKHITPNHVYGFVIGFTIPALATIGAPLSGGVFNPAIAIGTYGIGIVTGLSVAYDVLALYVISGLLGGALAAFFFNYLFTVYYPTR